MVQNCSEGGVHDVRIKMNHMMHERVVELIKDRPIDRF
uniref:Transposase n=1 Tax=Heterorhabditis bacteriophora TaxID=37862 RepID=A0A1I7XN29_HETBA